METNAAGALQEAHHGAVRWRKSGCRAASHPCCQRLLAGIPLQTMRHFPCNILIFLFFISRRQFCLVKPAHHVWDIKTELPRLLKSAAPGFEVKCCSTLHKGHYHHSGPRKWSTPDFSTYLTSKDSTPSCTRTERLLVLRKREKLENCALRENYRHNGAITERVEPLGSTVPVILETSGSVIAHLWPPGVDCGRTLLKAWKEWTFRDMEACWRRRLKPSLALVPVGIIFVASFFNTLMFLNVYITHECLPGLMAQIPLDIQKCAHCHGSLAEQKSGIGVMRSGPLVLYVEASHLLFNHLCQAD